MKVKDRDEFLRSQKIMRLATVGEGAAKGAGSGSGMPHVIPVWYLYAAKKFYVGTNSLTRKARNVERNEYVSFCIDVGVNPPDIHCVMGHGTARLVREKVRVRRIARKLLLRYFDAAKDNTSIEEVLDETDCIIEILPTRLVTWSY